MKGPARFLPPIIFLFTAIFPSVVSQDKITIKYSLLEEQPSNTVVGNIVEDGKLSTKFSSSILSTLQFSFLTSQSSAVGQNLFSVGSSDGILKTKSRIDRDGFCPHKAKCTINLDIAVKPVQYFMVIRVIIDIIDLNDNWPIFPEKQVSFDILESALVQTGYALPTAEDLDSERYGVRRYELVSNNLDKFELKVTKKRDGSTDVKLVLKQTLDREKQDSFLLKVVAVDGGSPAKSGTLTVNIRILDVNDNKPVFENSTYEASIKENQPAGTIVTRVVAHDPDINQYGAIQYGFSSRTLTTDGHLFGINNRTGEIYTKAVLDYEGNKLYQLSVLAKDKGQDSLPGYAQVLVHVRDENDHKPHITVSTIDDEATVPELAKIGTFVAMVTAEDEDEGLNGRVTCNLLDSNFKLEKQDEDYLVVTAAMLDAETQEKYSLTIQCSDFGIPPKVAQSHLNVTVSDENDNPPVFDKKVFLFHMFENTPIGYTVGRVSGTDKDKGKNGEIFYTLDRDAAGNFDININTGEIIAKHVFDHEKGDSPTFTVIATDKGLNRKHSKAKVTVNIMDRNDNDPIFSKSGYTFGIHENEPPGSEVGKVYATDVDSSPYNDIEYSLIENGNDSKTFAVETQTGIVRTRKMLDWEKQLVYHIIVKAHNRGSPERSGTATVTIFVTDKNDNKPIFIFPTKENNTVQIPKDMAEGYYITTVQAIDMDSDESSKVRFFISNGNVDDIFMIEPRTGVILTADNVRLDPAAGFQLKIGARDGGFKENVAYTTLNLVVNTTLIGTLAQTGEGLSMQNIIILISVLCIFAILALALVIAILTMRRNQRNSKNHKYNCRIETIKAYNKNNKNSSNPNLSQSQLELSNVSCMSNGTNGKKKEVSFCLDADNPGKVSQKSMPVRQSWPSMIDHISMQDPVACSSLLGSLHPRLGQIEMQELHLPDNTKQYAEERTKAYCKELEAKQLMNMLKKDQDADSSCSGEVSNTDSGRGASEEGEAIRVNCNAHSFDATVPHTDESSYSTNSNQVVPDQSYNKNVSGSHGYHGNDSYVYQNLQNAPKTNRTSGRGDDVIHDDSAYNELGGSYLPMQVSRSQWQQKTPEGSLHPRVRRFRERMKNPEESVISDMCGDETQESSMTSGNYSCSDISNALNGNDTKRHTSKPFVGVKLTPVPERSILSDSTTDDRSSTSGSYIVNPQEVVDPRELVDEINELFFKDMVV